jgi:hypothetical protein
LWVGAGDVAICLVAYEKPGKAKKKITGRGGDFES